MVDLKNFFARALQEQPQVVPSKRPTLHLRPKDVAGQEVVEVVRQVNLQVEQSGTSGTSLFQAKEYEMSELTEYEKFEQLLNEQAALNARVEAARQDAMASEIMAIRSKINRLGITPKDLGFHVVESVTSPGVSRGRGAPRGTVVAPKYRDPETGKTWSGRGRVPRWLQAVARADWEQYLIDPDLIGQTDSSQADSSSSDN